MVEQTLLSIWKMGRLMFDIRSLIKLGIYLSSWGIVNCLSCLPNSFFPHLLVQVWVLLCSARHITPDCSSKWLSDSQDEPAWLLCSPFCLLHISVSKIKQHAAIRLVPPLLAVRSSPNQSTQSARWYLQFCLKFLLFHHKKKHQLLSGLAATSPQFPQKAIDDFGLKGKHFVETN